MKSARRSRLMSIALLATVLMMGALPASAVDATVTSSGRFSNATGPGASRVIYCGPTAPLCPTAPASQVRWGDTSFSQRSGLGFAGSTSGIVVSGSDPFAVGQLTHFNNATTSGLAIDGVRLAVTITVATPGGSFELAVPVDLAIDETANQTPCAYPSTSPCADAITIVSLGDDLSATEVLGGTSYTLTILGFMSGGEIVDQFVSQEGRSNSVLLYAALEQNSGPVADAGADQTVEQSGSATNVTLDGSASSDPDGDELTYTWSSPVLAVDATGVNPTVALPAGTSTITLTVSDGEMTATDTVEVTVQDTTGPVITGTRTPEANANGWNNTDVTVGFECEDSGSGVASCSPDTTLTGEGAGQSVTRNAVDNAGNTSEATVGGINIDKTAPNLSFTGNAGTYTLDQTVTITCAIADPLSGIADVDCPAVNSPATSLGVGTHTLTATATDNAGNTATVSTTFQIAMTHDALCELAEQFSDNAGVAISLCSKLQAAEAAAARGQTEAAANMLNAFRNEVAAQAGKALTADEAATLTELAGLL
jgi:hypothetical protein